MAPTLTLIDGFEYGINPFVQSVTSLGGGIIANSTTAGSIMCDSSVKRSGAYSLKVTQDGASGINASKNYASTTTLVGAFYFRTAAAPAAVSGFLSSSQTNNAFFRMDVAGTISATIGTGAAATTAGTYADSNWHLIDFYIDSTNNPWTMDWKVDGAAQTQCTRATASVGLTNVRFGTATTTANLTFWIDDFVLSATAGDYPIGSTTTPHSVLSVVPTGDGTHNAGTNTIEDDAGNDIISPNAFPKVDNWPPDTAAYIRQATIDTGAYAEVTFANHDSSIGTIWDASPILGFTSSTAAANEGGCIISADSFSTSYEVYGTPAARTSYATTSTTAVNYKQKNTSTSDGIITRPAATWTTTDFDNLKARMGYSGDVTGNPRWLALMIQYAGVAGAAAGGETEFVGTIPI